MAYPGPANGPSAPGTQSRMNVPAFGGLQPRALAAQNPAFRVNSHGGSGAGPYGQGETPAAASIQNPFPLPGQGGRAPERLDPAMEAQIAQWQSAYTSRDGTGVRSRTNHDAPGSGAPVTSRGDTGGNAAAMSAANVDSGVATVVTGSDGKQKTVVRSGGGQTWQDPSLLEWDPAHFRLFVGNLAGEVTDDTLLKAFSKYPSVQRARVVRDKRTTKSKGYGFVSFIDGEEYFRAARDMQGKYIGSHPVLLRKSTTEIRPVVPKETRKSGKHNRSNTTRNHGSSSNSGVQKKQIKTKGGLKILG